MSKGNHTAFLFFCFLFLIYWLADVSQFKKTFIVHLQCARHSAECWGYQAGQSADLAFKELTELLKTDCDTILNHDALSFHKAELSGLCSCAYVDAVLNE